ncbi:hypothetical protein [Corynebacterium sp.]|uniref:hypothetical protein n=1 Tax=Corynebacterium sp. TaxID=1720 RepID=UPI0027B92FB9|nr:hypothetical protein [Corynebacterium sp.]
MSGQDDDGLAAGGDNQPSHRSPRAGRRRRAVRASDSANYDRGADRWDKQQSAWQVFSANKRVDPADPHTGFDDDFWREQRPPHSVY